MQISYFACPYVKHCANLKNCSNELYPIELKEGVKFHILQ